MSSRRLPPNRATAWRLFDRSELLGYVGSVSPASSMAFELTSILECPRCHGAIGVETSERFRCVACSAPYPVVNGIPRFVPLENYASNFGLQWNAFRRTQLDSNTGTSISRDRFLAQTGWTRRDLEGRLVLDVGCGAGRFAEIALDLGAEVVAVDYSTAVEAIRENLGHHDKLHIVQASIYELPLRPERFDFVYCLGVLQHTPDVRAAFQALHRPLKAGGAITVDIYPKTVRSRLKTKNLVRPFTRRMASERLFALTRRWVPRLLPLSLALGRVPRVGRYLRHLLPVSNYDGIYPLSPNQIEEWAILDTYDALAPSYDSPQTAATLGDWFRSQNYRDVEIFTWEQLVGRARKGTPPPSA